MDVILIDHARDPLAKLYGAYRTCYTALTPREVWDRIGAGETSHDAIQNFVEERLKTGHASPLEQVVFWFGISGVSRTLSHQLVRHRIGISFEQQSQRYCKYKPDSLEFVKPKTWEKSPDMSAAFDAHMVTGAQLYQAALDAGIPGEDARFVLPNATPTNFQVMVNFTELLHICDLRLCWRAQWEIRRMVGLMRAEVKKVLPELARVMQPKCGEARTGYCDEPHKDYCACPLSKVRPHKADLLDAWAVRRGNGAGDLTEADIQPPEAKP